MLGLLPDEARQIAANARESRMPTREELDAKANQPAEESLRLHSFYRGKIQVVSKCPIRDARDFAYWYTPGVAAPCLAIQADPAKVYEFTSKANLIAVVSDGSRVLGLGNIGPHAALPVMEGKALLFKHLGGVDAIPICLATQDTREFVRTVRLLEPAFGGINLEDIAQPRCFRILEELRKTMTIPVWHDDQQGTATVLIAGLMGALKVVGKRMNAVRIAMIGVGAANVANYRLLKACGVDPAQIMTCDKQGILHRNRRDVENEQVEFAEKWQICQETNRDARRAAFRKLFAELTSAWHSVVRVPELLTQPGCAPWPRMRLSSPVRIPLPRSGPGMPRRPEHESSPREEATSLLS